MAISDWAVEERPREKLLRKGAEALSDAELLAIFLRTGVKGCSAVDLARNLLNDTILIAPASANIMAKLAHGIADDLVTTLCLAIKIVSHH